MEIYKCECCGSAVKEEELRWNQYIEYHSEVDTRQEEKINSYYCPYCGSVNSCEKLYVDDDQKVFDDHLWHSAYACTEDCADCSTSKYRECTRGIKMTLQEWRSERKEAVAAACKKSFAVCRLLSKVKQNGVDMMPPASQVRAITESVELTDSEKKILKLYKNDELLQKAVRENMKLGIFKKCGKGNPADSAKLENLEDAVNSTSA